MKFCTMLLQHYTHADVDNFGDFPEFYDQSNTDADFDDKVGFVIHDVEYDNQ